MKFLCSDGLECIVSLDRQKKDEQRERNNLFNVVTMAC